MHMMMFLLDGKMLQMGFDIGSVTFVIYTNDLPKITDKDAKVVL
jgi:hypothetical protein